MDFPEANRLTTADEEISIFTNEVKNKVRSKLAVEIMFSTFTDGREITFVDCTFPTVREVSYNKYYASGKVTVKDNYGDRHTANYEAYVYFYGDTKEFEVDLEIDYFYRE